MPAGEIDTLSVAGGELLLLLLLLLKGRSVNLGFIRQAISTQLIISQN
jgi:hypothetical protein